MRIFLLLLLVSLTNIILSQTDNCGASSTLLTPGSSCAYTTGNTSGFSDGNQGCATGTEDDDGWFRFVATATTHTVTVDGATGFDAVLGVYNTCGGTQPTGGACVDGTGDGGIETRSLSGLTIGTTYYICVYDYYAGSGTSFSICVTAPPAAPANDNCAGAIGLTVNSGSTCVTSTTATSSGATQSQAGCVGNADDDVWFSFTATATTHSINVTPGTMGDVVIQSFTGACGSLTTYTCVDNSGGTSAENATLTGLSIGTVYYFRVYSYATTSGSFTVCVTTPPAPFDPCSAITNIASCGSSISTTIASGTGAYGTSACGWTTAGYEKIFTFTPASSGNYFIQQGSSFAYIDYQFKAVSAGCSSSGWTCVDDISGAGTSASAMSLTGGTQYYILLDPESTAGGNVTFTITCPPPTPANDECTGSYSLTVNSGATCTSQTGGTLYGATASAQTTTCNATYDDDDVWYSFVATSTSHNLSISNIAGNNTDLYHSVFAGTCGSLTNPLVCQDANTSSLTGLTIGTTYFVRIYTWGTTANANTTFSVCITTPVDPCATPPNIASCGTSINTTIPAGTGLYGTSACGWTTAGYEMIYTFTPASSGNYLIQQTSSFAYIDYQFKPVSAGCSSSGWTCIDDISGAGTSASAMALTAGVQYYILLDPESTAGGNVSFSILCPPTPPANDNCPGAYTVTTNSGTSCTSLANGTLYGASATSFTNGCGGTADDDVWYSFVASSSTHSISITNVAGSTTDMYHSVYAGSCASLGNPILCSDPNTSSISGLILGNTYYVRVYSWTSTAGQTSTFSVCVTTPAPTGPCGNPANNDYCSNPATLTQGAGTFSSTTSSTYSSDQPGNVSSVFCGSLENNSWYSFVATGTTASFPFTSINGCTWNDGVQAQVYKVSTNASGCCTSFTSVSNCYNPGTTSTGTVNATGLVSGQTYILMVDGYAGDVCNFTVSGWTAVGILPMELLTFVGRNENEKNKLQWVTASEKNTKYFTIEKSNDGVTFEKLLNVDAAGFSTSPKNYNAFDLTPFKEITYYRLKLVDTDNSFDYSNIIAIDNKNLTDYISNARPNPTNGELEFDININSKEKVLIEVYSNTGRLITSEEKTLDSGYRSLNLDLNKYDSGIYLLKVSFGNSGKSEIQKIIKN